MDRRQELERLIIRRAEVVREMKTKGRDIALDLRLAYLDEEFRKQRAKPLSFVEKTRTAMERLFARS